MAETEDTETEAEAVLLHAEQLLTLEMVEHIFQYLDIKSLCRAASVCKLFSRARWTYADLSAYSSKVDGKVLAYVLGKQPRHLLIPRAAAAAGGSMR